MPRRRVTMLEAFQVSAQKSVERAASEQRRLAEEREREARRAEVAKATQAWRRRIGNGVGSILSGFRSAEDEAEERREGEPSPSASTVRGAGAVPRGAAAAEPRPGDTSAGDPDAEGLEADADHGGAVEARAQAARTVAPIDLHAPPASRELAELLERVGDPERFVVHRSPEALGSLDSAGSLDLSRSPERRGVAGGAAVEGATGDGRVAEREALADALESVAVPEFALPISGRTFGLVLGLALVTVFVLGLSIGRGQGPEAAGEGIAAGAPRAEARRVAPEVTLPRSTRGAGAPNGAQNGAQNGAPGGSAGTPREAALAPVTLAPVTLAPVTLAPGAEAPAVEAVDDGLTPADRAFLDPRNRFSVLAATYKNIEANHAIAWAAYDDLAAAGFPVVRPVHGEEPGKIFLLVGAAPDEGAITALRDRIKAYRYGRKRQAAFASADIVLIARYR